MGVMHQVSYSSSVSTFCRNEIKDRNYKSVQQHIFISFSFSGKKWLAPPMLDVIFVGNFPQPPLNHSREKEWPPLKIIIAHPLGKLLMFPKTTFFSFVRTTSFPTSNPISFVFPPRNFTSLCSYQAQTLCSSQSLAGKIFKMKFEEREY